ncbi:ATP-binding protein [Clostridium sp. DL1XJH146]
MFIGREYEMESLNRLHKDNQFQFVVVYGRRRVGKTTLLSEFCKDKKAIFYVAEEYNDKMALESFSKKILEYYDMQDFITTFESWEKAFIFLAKKAKNEQLLLVIDEFPYIATANKTITSLIQNLIDHYLKDTKLFFIICGSSMSFMEKEVLSYKSPLYGRRTAQFNVEPFGFYDSIRFLPNYNLEEKVMSYGILGGIPQYILKFKDNISIKDNVIRAILDKSSYLHEEPKNLLKQELREPAIYNSIIEVIANGASKLNEVSTKTGEAGDKCSKYIKTLIDLKIVEKETPVGEKEKTRKSIYRLKDNLFRFWYKFVFDNGTLIEQGMLDYVYENKIKEEISNYLGEVFEDICIQFLKKKNKQLELPFVFEKIGRWWGNNPVKRRQEEIDILAIDKSNAIFGECKWRNELLDMKVVDSLIEKSNIQNFSNKYYIFFSKSGFTERVIQYEKTHDNILLYSLADIII